MPARGSKLTVVLVVVAAAAAAAAAAAPQFAGNVCGLIPAKQVTAVPGLSARCTNAKPSQGPGSKIYVGTWAAATGTTPTLQVTVSQYSDPGALRLAKQNLRQGFPGGTPRKVAGIGTAAYEATGAGAAGLHFTKGKYVVVVILGTSGASGLRAVEGLARTVAGHL